MVEKLLSCGFLVESKYGYLALLPYGKRAKIENYDIPKGIKEENESDKDCALRELKEETGIEIKNDKDIKDLGVFSYLPNKDLHLFYIYLNDIQEDFNFYCSSMFKSIYPWNVGEMVPEIVRYKWTKRMDLFYKGLQSIFKNLLS